MKKFSALLLSLAMLLSLCACGKAASDKASPAEAPAECAEYAADAAAGGLSAADRALTEDGGAGSGLPDADPEKIIYSSEVTVETTDFDETISALEALVKEYGGYIESSSINGTNYYDKARGYSSRRSAGYALRIPSEKFSTLMNSLSALGNVPYSYTYTENVTTQYYDSEARLTAYAAQESRLLEMMEKAETVSDVISIEEKLTELRYQIERLQSALNNWDRRVSFSSVNIDIEEVWEYTPEAEQKPSYGQKLWRALQNGLENVADFFKDLLVFIVGALPVLAVLAVPALILVPVLKKQRAKRRTKKQARADAEN